MMKESSSPEKNSVLRELLDIMGRDRLPVLSVEETEDVLKAGVPYALSTQLDLMLGGDNERTRAWLADRWLDRAGYSPVQKMAVQQRIQIDPATLAALKAIADEDVAGPPAIDAVIVTGELSAEPSMAESEPRESEKAEPATAGDAPGASTPLLSSEQPEVKTAGDSVRQEAVPGTTRPGIR